MNVVILLLLAIVSFRPLTSFAQRGLVPPENTEALTTTGNVYAILVGISDYTHLRPLKFADDDALLFKQFLESGAGGMVPDSNIT
ncbi:MAG: hypothetical protein ACK5XN_35745, partial [Bacteroidota bacterium]